MQWPACLLLPALCPQACETAASLATAAQGTPFAVQIGLCHGEAWYTPVGCDQLSNLSVRARVQ